MKQFQSFFKTSVSSTETDIKRIVIILIKLTHYDDKGYTYRFLLGVLPSNSLATMYALTKQAIKEIIPSGIPVETYMLEDSVHRHAKQLKKLYRRFPEKGTKLIVGLVAVQTAQFPRACDLINRWQAKGATCAIGGFHISGSISTLLDGIKDAARPDVPCEHKMPPEIQTLMDKGVIVFHGEAENGWRQVLQDILNGQPRQLYRGGQPNLAEAPLPQYPYGYFEKSFVTTMNTFDTGRGCPFACSFCSVINVQGRAPRQRDPQAIISKVKRICERRGKANFFFTDDNFARNPMWEQLLDGLIKLRQRGCKISFMIEADLACHKIERFIPKLAAAGCSQIFMGVESMNPKNLAEAHKRQNKIEQYEKLWQLCHEQGLIVHAGYIIGFSQDTPESVERDVEELFERGVDQASFFMLTPIPGSEDHARAINAKIPIDGDFTKFDSCHAVVKHPRMSREEWYAAYNKAWEKFYSADHLITALKRCKSREIRLNLLRNYAWYRWSFATEHTHPMIAGFYRFRSFSDRRPSMRSESYLRYLTQEIARHFRYIGRLCAEFYRFQYVVFETEYAPIIAHKRAVWDERAQERIHGVGDWFKLTFGKRINRQWLHYFWKNYASKRWHLLWNPLAYYWHVRMLPYIVSEVVYTVRFLFILPRLVKMTTT